MLLILRGSILWLHYIFIPSKQKRALKRSWGIHVCSPNLQVSGTGHLWCPYMMDTCLVAKMCIVCLCLRPSKIQRIFISFNSHFEVSWFLPRGEMLRSHCLKTTMLWVFYLMSSAEKTRWCLFWASALPLFYWDPCSAFIYVFWEEQEIICWNNY